MRYSFKEKLEYSLGEREIFDISILKKIIPKCIDIVKTDEAVDKTGIDYVATLEDGATINIDAKTREAGSSRWWLYGEPELALERWSVVRENNIKPKIGWTLNTESLVDYILYTFDKDDSNKFYFIPFQLLRIAFQNNGRDWSSKYGIKLQLSEYNSKWHSSAVFVPASVILAEVNKLMTGIA